MVDPPAVAEILAVGESATATVEALDVAVVLSAVTVTVAWTVATAVLEFFKVTTVPPEGAGPLSVTTPTDGLPPVTVVGLKTRERTAGARTMRVSAFVTRL